MDGSTLGLLLRSLREKRDLSLRELGRLAEVDHAYIHRLETGDRELPSHEVLGKLAKALKAGKREANMLLYLANRPDTPAELVELVVKDPTIAYNVFAGAASMAFRGKRPNYHEVVQRVRRILAEDDGDG